MAKLTDTGSTARFTWVQQVGTYHYINASALAVQGNAVYLAGTLSDVTTFGTLPPQVPSGTNSRPDGFVAKLTDAGPTASFNWVVATSSSEDESAQDLAVVGNTVYVSGHFREEGKFGSTTLQSVNYFTYPFVAAITDDGSSGRFIWAKSNSSINGSLSALLPTSAGLYLGIFSQVRTGRVTYDSRASLGLLAYRSPLATAQPAALPLGLFPNPAHGTVAVALPPGFGPGRPVLTLFDALGQVVRVMPAAASLAPASVQVDLAGLAPGVYVVRIAGAEKVATSRLVVE